MRASRVCCLLSLALVFVMAASEHNCDQCGTALTQKYESCPICGRVPPRPLEHIGNYVDGRYAPNIIPLSKRIWNILLSLLLLIYGAYGLWKGDLYIPGKRGNGMHLNGFAAWAMYGAFIGACLAMLSVVVDHFDKRDNEAKYKYFAGKCNAVGWSLFFLSIVIAIWTENTKYWVPTHF